MTSLRYLAYLLRLGLCQVGSLHAHRRKSQPTTLAAMATTRPYRGSGYRSFTMPVTNAAHANKATPKSTYDCSHSVIGWM
jgi:hypothetical protein